MSLIPDIVDPERRLALAYARKADRAALALLWALDERLGAIVARTHEEMLGTIRLAWWRDALAALAQGAPAGEPLLEGLAPLVRDGRFDAARLSMVAQGWQALLAPLPLDGDALDAFASLRGGGLFLLAGRDEIAGMAEAGAGWALADLARRISDAPTAQCAEAQARALLGRSARRWPATMRPLAVLAALAQARGANGGMRMLRAIWAGTTGRC